MPTFSRFIVRNFFGFCHLNMADCDKRLAENKKKRKLWREENKGAERDMVQSGAVRDMGWEDD